MIASWSPLKLSKPKKFCKLSNNDLLISIVFWKIWDRGNCENEDKIINNKHTFAVKSHLIKYLLEDQPRNSSNST